MVTKDIINKTLNEAIIKCRKPVYSHISLSNQIKGVMNKFAEQSRELDHETGWIINGKGKIVGTAQGDEGQVEIGEVEYLKTHIENDWCKDLIEKYRQESEEIWNHREDYTLPDDFENLKRPYEMELTEYLKNHKECWVNIVHNHPGAYDGAKLDYNMFTCLSEGDMMNLVNPVMVSDFFLYNLNRSVTADCSNGSRMTLTNLNEINHSVNPYIFKKAIRHLNDTWANYYRTVKNSAQNEFYKRMTDLSSNTGKTVKEEVNDFLKEESLKVFPKMLEDNIKEFEELGFELRVDWL